MTYAKDTSVSTTQNNVSAVNKAYLAFNPTTSTAFTGFTPTSAALPQLTIFTNTNATNNVVFTNNSGNVSQA